MTVLRGWRYWAFMGSLGGVLFLTLYPIVISPMMNVDKYKAIQASTRSGVIQADIQPGNMKVWSDPFDRKKKDA